MREKMSAFFEHTFKWVTDHKQAHICINKRRGLETDGLGVIKIYDATF